MDEKKLLILRKNRKDNCYTCKYRMLLSTPHIGFPACWGFDPINMNEDGSMKCYKGKENE